MDFIVVMEEENFRKITISLNGREIYWNSRSTGCPRKNNQSRGRFSGNSKTRFTERKNPPKKKDYRREKKIYFYLRNNFLVFIRKKYRGITEILNMEFYTENLNSEIKIQEENKEKNENNQKWNNNNSGEKISEEITTNNFKSTPWPRTQFYLNFGQTYRNFFHNNKELERTVHLLQFLKNSKLKNIFCEQLQDQIHRTLLWRSTFVGKLKVKIK